MILPVLSPYAGITYDLVWVYLPSSAYGLLIMKNHIRSEAHGDTDICTDQASFPANRDSQALPTATTPYGPIRLLLRQDLR